MFDRVRSILWRMRATLSRKRLDGEMAAEIDNHLDLAIAENIRRGMSQEEARRKARLDFGSVDQTKEAYRDRRGIRAWEILTQDLGYACRSLRKNPAFALTAMATLALGIGVNTMIFSVVNAVLLRSLPYPDADRLAILWTTSPRENLLERPTGIRAFEDWREQAHSFEEMAVFRTEPVVLMEEPENEALEATFASPGVLRQLGAQPMLGRIFTDAEAARGDRLVVLSHALWQRRFHSSSAAIGQVVRIERLPAQIIGVLPPEFRPISRDTQLWLPQTTAAWWSENRESRSPKYGWNVLAKLRPGVPLEKAQAEMEAIAAGLAQAYPREHHGTGARAVSMRDQVIGQSRLAIELLFAAVLLVLLIACANLGNLLLARGAGRSREVAVRAALGAGRGRLIAQLLTESAALSVVSGGAGFAIAALGLNALLAVAPRTIPRLDEISLDHRAAIFTLAVSLLSAVLFGLAPALRLVDGALQSGARVVGGGRSARKTRDLLVVAECALAVVLLAGAGLLVRSLIAVTNVDPGYQAPGVLTVDLHSPAMNDPLNPGRFQELVQRLETLPGVRYAGGVSRLFQANIMQVKIAIVGGSHVETGQPEPTSYEVIAGHYLQALGVPLMKGRYFSGQDGPVAPKAAIVNDVFVRKFLKNENPIGMRFRRGEDPTEYTIVGVIGDMRRQNLTRTPIPEVFWPHMQRPWGMTLVVRTANDPLAMAGAVRKTIHEADRGVVIKKVSTLDRQLDDRIAQRRFQTWLLGLFAALALALAGIGIYGLMHYSVAERTQEIGIRVTLGAQPRDVFDMVVRQALRLVGIGLLCGVLGALWLTRAMATLLYGVSVYDPVTYLGVSALLAGFAVVASSVPAWRATRSDPLAALRQE